MSGTLYWSDKNIHCSNSFFCFYLRPESWDGESCTSIRQQLSESSTPRPDSPFSVSDSKSIHLISRKGKIFENKVFNPWTCMAAEDLWRLRSPRSSQYRSPSQVAPWETSPAERGFEQWIKDSSWFLPKGCFISVRMCRVRLTWCHWCIDDVYTQGRSSQSTAAHGSPSAVPSLSVQSGVYSKIKIIDSKVTRKWTMDTRQMKIRRPKF